MPSGVSVRTLRCARREARVSMDVVNYRIEGAEMQFVEVDLDPGEAVVGEAGGKTLMDAGTGMDTVFGDGRQTASGGSFGKPVGAGQRLVTGESLFTSVYMNDGAGFEIESVGKIETAMSGGQGPFLAGLTGRAPSGCRACRSRGWREEGLLLGGLAGGTLLAGMLGSDEMSERPPCRSRV
jgi:hypothetical protein